MAVSVSELDKKTVSMLDKGIAHLAAKLDPKYKTSEGKPLSDKTKKKVQALKNKYVMQKGKTVNLFNKHKKKPGLKGLSVNAMSVEKIYQALGKETKDNAFKAWFRESPGRIVNVAGGGLALGGAILSLHGTGAKTAILDALKTLFGTLTGPQKLGITMLGVGALALIVGHTMNHMQKNKFKNAAIKNDAENAMNENSARDNEYLSGTKKDAAGNVMAVDINALAQEASVDPNLMQHLQEVIANPNTPADVAKNATKILTEAQKLQVANKERSQGAQLKEAIELSAKGAVHGASGHLFWKKEGVSYADELKDFAVQQEVEALLEQQNKKVEAHPDPADASIGITNGAARAAYKNIVDFLNDTSKLSVDAIRACGSADALVTAVIAANTADYQKCVKNGGSTDVSSIKNHLKSLITARFNNIAAKDKIAALNAKGITSIALDGAGNYTTSGSTINGKSLVDIKREGMETILKLAEMVGIEGFDAPAKPSPVTAAYDNALMGKYSALCAKFDGLNGVQEAVKSVQKGELNLEGMEK